MQEVVRTILTEAKVPTGVRPVMAIADFPDSYPDLERQLHKSARMLAPMGIDALPCPVDALEYRGDRVWLGDRAIDVVFRLFMIEDLLKPGAVEMLETRPAGVRARARRDLHPARRRVVRQQGLTRVVISTLPTTLAEAELRQATAALRPQTFNAPLAVRSFLTARAPNTKPTTRNADGPSGLIAAFRQEVSGD